MILGALGEGFPTRVRVLAIALSGAIDICGLGAFVEEILDAVLDEGSFRGDFGLAGALGGDALAVLGGGGGDAALFFAEAPALQVAAGFGRKVEGVVDGAAVIVAEAAGGFGAGDWGEGGVACLGVDELVGWGQWWLVALVLGRLVGFEASECVAESALDDVLGVAC